MHFTVFISPYAFHSMHFTVCISHYAFHSMQFTVCISQCTLYSMHFTECISLYSIYSVYSLYSLLEPLEPSVSEICTTRDTPLKRLHLKIIFTSRNFFNPPRALSTFIKINDIFSFMYYFVFLFCLLYCGSIEAKNKYICIENATHKKSIKKA